MNTTAIKKRPILFSGPMVRGILDGEKTVTRRVVKPQPPEGWNPVVGYDCPVKTDANGEEYPGPEIFGAADEEFGVKCPYGQPGDRLWVRETWRYYWDDTLWCCINYRADDARIKPDVPDHNTGHMMAERCDQSLDDKEPWKPSIHMPRWASRITLEVVSVRVERLQDITEEDAKAEGFERDFRADGSEGYGAGLVYARDEFAVLWDKLNASRGHSWESNPWVWRVEFKRLIGG